MNQYHAGCWPIIGQNANECQSQNCMQSDVAGDLFQVIMQTTASQKMNKICWCCQQFQKPCPLDMLLRIVYRFRLDSNSESQKCTGTVDHRSKCRQKPVPKVNLALQVNWQSCKFTQHLRNSRVTLALFLKLGNLSVQSFTLSFFKTDRFMGINSNYLKA